VRRHPARPADDPRVGDPTFRTVTQAEHLNFAIVDALSDADGYLDDVAGSERSKLKVRRGLRQAVRLLGRQAKLLHETDARESRDDPSVRKGKARAATAKRRR